MQTLQKCMEDMKAVYRLNEEKLDFNHKVLKDREAVNKNTIENLKKKQRKMKNMLRTVKEKFEIQSKKYVKENKNSTRDYKKFTKEFLSLQKKYERFEKSDKNRFTEVWSMNQNEAFALCEKIKDCDRVIHVQQLGIAWQPPTDPIFQKSAGGTGDAGAQSLMGGQNPSVMDSSKHGVSKSEMMDDGQMSNSTAKPEDQNMKENFYKVKIVFEILIAEASYLIDDKAFSLCEGKSQKEQFLIMIDSIRKSLGIESMEDVTLLVDTFYEFGPQKRERLAKEEEERKAAKEDQQSNPELGQTKKDDKGKKAKDAKPAQPEPATIEDEEEEEKDPMQPDFDLDDVVEVL